MLQKTPERISFPFNEFTFILDTKIVTKHLILAYKWDSLVRVSRRVDLCDPHQLESNTYEYHMID